MAETCILQNMKILIITTAILSLLIFSGTYSLLDAHVFAWIPSEWIVLAQTTAAILSVLSILVYATLYIYYALKHSEKPTSR